MTTTETRLDNLAADRGIDPELLASAVDALQGCAIACRICADACLDEPDVAEMVACIRLDRACEAVCRAAASVVTTWRRDDREPLGALLEACIEYCRVCGDECEQHDATHCQECALMCRRAESACRALLVELDGLTVDRR